MRLVRPKLRFLALAPVCLALGWVPAPARPRRADVPAPRTSSRRCTGVRPAGGLSAAKLTGRARGAGPVSFRSAVIAAPGRFDLVGLAGELRPLEIRARDAGGEWSEWVAAEDGDPVYFGGADELQLRAAAGARRATLHYVDVAGHGRSRRRPQPARRAAAKPTRPTIVSRAAVGGEPRRGRLPSPRPPDARRRSRRR